MKVCVTNAVLSNTGDAAIFQSIHTSLVESGQATPEEISVFDSNARTSRSLYPSWHIYQQIAVSPPREPARLRRVLQWFRIAITRLVTYSARHDRIRKIEWILRRSQYGRSLHEIMECDALISSGGTYLVDHYDFSPRRYELELASALGKPIVLWTQSLGPFETSRSKDNATAIANITSAVSFRDEASKKNWEKLESAAVHRVLPDCVFALRPVPASDETSSKHAVLSVRKWSRGVTSHSMDPSLYRNMMRTAVEAVDRLGYEARSISTCQGVVDYAHDDSNVADDIFAGLNVHGNSDHHGPSELMGIVGRASVVISTRMHLAIMAIIQRVPVIAIAYEFKTIELFRGIGLGDFVISIEDCNDDWIQDRILRVDQNPECARLTEEQLNGLRKEALSAVDLLSVSISSNGGVGRA